ncbi:cupredoxin domain-containing protein [Patescibacteria group bacterium]|nr:cupredoxin domain-containing protein [Patescibacteria group bacterium]MCL5410104.1 cupredoxin domain-containing protein [Patescibacteria group bacterium]
MNNTEEDNYKKRPLWQWIMIYSIIGGIIYFAAYYFVLKPPHNYNIPVVGWSQPQEAVQQPIQQLTPMQNNDTKNVVILDSSGFSPATLTIKAGFTVIWKNNSGQSATVNSDPHPIHTDYPPLNLGTFPNGGTLQLTFDKPGTYGYHNHLNPNEKGTIIVQ